MTTLKAIIPCPDCPHGENYPVTPGCGNDTQPEPGHTGARVIELTEEHDESETFADTFGLERRRRFVSEWEGVQE